MMSCPFEPPYPSATFPADVCACFLSQNGGREQTPSKTFQSGQFSAALSWAELKSPVQHSLQASTSRTPTVGLHPHFLPESVYDDSTSTPSPVWNHTANQQHVQNRFLSHSQSATPPKPYAYNMVGPCTSALSPFTPARYGSGSESDPFDVEEWDKEIGTSVIVTPASASSPIPLSKEEEAKQFRARVQYRRLFVATPSPPRRQKKQSPPSSSGKRSTAEAYSKKSEKAPSTRKSRARKEKVKATAPRPAAQPPRRHTPIRTPHVHGIANVDVSPQSVDEKNPPIQPGPLRAEVALKNFSFNFLPIVVGTGKREEESESDSQLDEELLKGLYGVDEGHDMEAELDKELQEGMFRAYESDYEGDDEDMERIV